MGGYLLSNIKCKRKIGVEINPFARSEALIQGIKAVEKTEMLEDEIADVIISNNALEHVERPLDEIKELYKKLKIGGIIVFVVPCSKLLYEYHENDINQHLYSWSPMELGNLFTRVGFKVLESKPYIHAWPPDYLKIATLGRDIFDEICEWYARSGEPLYDQIRIVAQK